MLLAQISDLHVRRDDRPMSGAVKTRRYAAKAVDSVNSFAPDAVFVTGDLTDVGTDEDYALVRGELDRLDAPYFIIPGNHDRHDTLRAAFRDHSYLPSEGPLNWVVDDFPLRLIGLDSVLPDEGHGLLSTETLAWLDQTLASSARPTIVGLHHPPFAVGMPHMDKIICLNGAEMAEVISRHAHVALVISGHLHRAVSACWAGTVAHIAPSVAHQVALSFTERTIPEWVLEPPAMLLHRCSPEGDVVTHVAHIGDFGGTQPFLPDVDYPGA